MKLNYEHWDEDLEASLKLGVHPKYKPIIFSRNMIHALQNDAKIETRRPVMPDSNTARMIRAAIQVKADIKHGKPAHELQTVLNYCPYGNPGDILWVREKFAPPSAAQNDDVYMYAADYPVNPFVKGIWKPSIHMPRKACRIYLEVVSRKLQRIQDITADQCIHEGIEFADDHGLLLTHGPITAFQHLWDQMYGQHEWKAWAKNPLVWAVEFKKIEL